MVKPVIGRSGFPGIKERGDGLSRNPLLLVLDGAAIVFVSFFFLFLLAKSVQRSRLKDDHIHRTLLLHPAATPWSAICRGLTDHGFCCCPAEGTVFPIVVINVVEFGRKTRYCRRRHTSSNRLCPPPPGVTHPNQPAHLSFVFPSLTKPVVSAESAEDPQPASSLPLHRGTHVHTGIHTIVPSSLSFPATEYHPAPHRSASVMSASSACVPLFQLSGCSSPTTEPESIETADCHQTQYPSPPSTHSSWNATGTNGIAARSATNADEVFGWHHLRRSTNVHSPLHNQLFPHAILPTSPLLFQQNHPYLVDRFGQPNQLFAFPHVLHTGAPFQPYFAVLPGAPHYASYLPPNQMNTTSAPHSQFQPFPQPQFSFTDGDKEVPYNETLNTAMRGDHNLYALQSATSDTSPNLTSSPLAASSPFSTRIDSRGDGDSAALSPPVRSSSTPSLASTSSPAMLGSPLLSVVPHGSGKVRTVFKPSKIAWVGNLPEHTNDREIRMFFETECSVKTLNYVQRTHSCFLQFESDDEADRFISTFDGVCFQGHKLICRIRQISQTQFSPPPALTDMLRYKDRFFIVKSLSVEDIRISLQTGLWATQLKNEPVLNRAYATSNNVFLIFSVNKSGQFFGYARMESPIQADESIPEIAWASIDAVKGNAENDNFIRGRWGRPFKIRWINTRLIAFSRVAGVRNSWNSNKPVHVARDVTEVEPNAASVVIQEFFHPETSQ